MQETTSGKIDRERVDTNNTITNLLFPLTLMIFLIALAVSMILFDPLHWLVSRAGGGGGGGGGGGAGGSGGSLHPVVAVAYILMIIAIIIYLLIAQHKLREAMKAKREKITRSLKLMAEFDPSWDEEKLMEYARETFIKIQDAWSRNDRKLLMSMLSASLYKEWKGMLNQMDKFGQRNVMKDLTVTEVEIIDFKDFTDDNKDCFTAKISAMARDYTVDREGNWVSPKWRDDANPNILMELKPFTELWTFQWKGEGCVLTEIDQQYSLGKFAYSELVMEDEKYMFD